MKNESTDDNIENETKSQWIIILDFLKKYKDAFAVLFVVIGAIWYLINNYFVKTTQTLDSNGKFSGTITGSNATVNVAEIINQHGLSDNQFKSLIKIINEIGVHSKNDSRLVSNLLDQIDTDKKP